MADLVDTSVLGRLANTVDPFHTQAASAVLELHRRGELLHVTAQNLVEFRNMGTRATSLNGLGLSAAEVQVKAAVFEAIFPLLVETPGIFLAWKAIVESLGIIGKQVHDARLVAVCQTHAVTHLLTFNISHFARMTGVLPSVVFVDPAAV